MEKSLDQVKQVVKDWKRFWLACNTCLTTDTLYAHGWIDDRGSKLGCTDMVPFIDTTIYVETMDVLRNNSLAIVMNRGDCWLSAAAMGVVFQELGYEVDYRVSSKEDHTFLILDKRWKVDTVHVTGVNSHNWSEVKNGITQVSHTDGANMFISNGDIQDRLMFDTWLSIHPVTKKNANTLSSAIAGTKTYVTSDTVVWMKKLLGVMDRVEVVFGISGFPQHTHPVKPDEVGRETTAPL